MRARAELLIDQGMTVYHCVIIRNLVQCGVKVESVPWITILMTVNMSPLKLYSVAVCPFDPGMTP
jgi:hypothetical protein